MENNGPLICVYCGTPTTGTEALEHVVPESLGFTDTLYAGAVCTKCNHDLGSSVDGKVFNELMMAVGVVATGTPGKGGPRRHIRHKKGTVTKRDEIVTMEGATVGRPNEHAMSRVLAKVAVNVLTFNCGSEQVRQHHADLIRFVRMPRSRKEVWPFEAKYLTSSSLRHGFGGILRLSEVDGNIDTIEAIILYCASGVFAVPLHRHDKNNIARAKSHTEEAVRLILKRGRFSGISTGYSAANNDGK